jgi:hypothetical protein
MKDPIVEEIRRIRDEHAKKFNYDLKAICADIRKQQAQYGDRVVRLTPKKKWLINKPLSEQSR